MSHPPSGEYFGELTWCVGMETGRGQWICCQGSVETDSRFSLSSGRCGGCGEDVVGDGAGVVALDRVFHIGCFVCSTCRAQLRGQHFYAVERRAYCEGCYVVSGGALTEGCYTEQQDGEAGSCLGEGQILSRVGLEAGDSTWRYKKEGAKCGGSGLSGGEPELQSKCEGSLSEAQVSEDQLVHRSKEHFGFCFFDCLFVPLR